MLVATGISFLTGRKTGTIVHGIFLTENRALARGLLLVGLGLCTHAWFFAGYENHPLVKWPLFIVGVVSIVVGFCIPFASR